LKNNHLTAFDQVFFGDLNDVRERDSMWDKKKWAEIQVHAMKNTSKNK